MTFQSILFESPVNEAAWTEERGQPSCFADLNLDQIVDRMVRGREAYNLEPLFYSPVRDAATVRYRQEVVRDLERTEVREAIDSFAQGMETVRGHLAGARNLRYRYQQQGWFLAAAERYCELVTELARRLASLDVASRGLSAFRDYVAAYTSSASFTSLDAETRHEKDALGEIRYTVHIRGPRVAVGTYEGEADYSAEVEKTFERFKQGAVNDYRVNFRDWGSMNHVEGRILERVARLYPDTFSGLDEYCHRYAAFLDHAIARFDREVQFYLAYLDLIEPCKASGLSFCYPDVTQSGDVYAREAFDLALANKLAREGTTVVSNDFRLTDPERIIVVTGPNQGGKTTFARMFGQLHYLRGLGLPVPGRTARLSLPDRVFTHFEKQEDLATLRGKLQDELVRLHAILEEATPASILILNESFASTTVEDAVLIGQDILGRLSDLRLLAVCVTFIDELASLNETTVSMVSTVDPADPAIRTYKVVRMPADGRAYATVIARKYGLDYEHLRQRIRP